MTDRLIDLFANVLNVPASELNEDSSPANTPAWDSLATINLVLAIEQEFKVKLRTQQIMSMSTIALARATLIKLGAAGLA